MHRWLRLFVYVLSVVPFAGCASAGSAMLPGVSGESRDIAMDAPRAVRAEFSVLIPHTTERPPSLRRHYLSPATKSMTIAIAGSVSSHKVVGLTSHSPDCSARRDGRVCTATVDLPPCASAKPCYTATVATYDAVSCRPMCRIPPNAHELSGGQTAAFSVSVGKSNAVSLTLDGIPASVAIVPGSSSTDLSGDAVTGFDVPKCVVTPMLVSVLGVDARGNDIVGAGAPVPKLISDDPAHLAVTPPQTSSPNTFELVPPSTLEPSTIPAAHGVVHLTADATPLAGAAAPRAVLKTTVTFGDDLCGIITEFSIPGTGYTPQGIAAGPDGALWFTEGTGNEIGRITTDGTISQFRIPGGRGSENNIVAGPDRALWFTEPQGVGRITTTGSITQSAIFDPCDNPFAIATGPDDALWFTENQAGKIARISTGGTITNTFPVPNAVNPQYITTGPDGALWFTDGYSIGRMTTTGAVSQTTIPTSPSQPESIAPGPDGALWFTETYYSANKIGRITTQGSITEYPIPTLYSESTGIAPGPDGAMWFSEGCGNKIGRITTDGTVTNEYAVPTQRSEPESIVAGPDGAMWFTEAGANKIARLQ